MLMRWLLGLVLLGSAAGAYSAETVEVPTTTDLQAVGALAEERQLPVLLVFTASHCGYCELLEEEILRPMVLSGDYRDRVIIRKIQLDGGSLRDFQGRTVAADRYATRHNVFVTPTMVFVDASGRELAERLVGINTVEMFAGLVDAAIDEARDNLAARASAPPLARAAPAR